MSSMSEREICIICGAPGTPRRFLGTSDGAAKRYDICIACDRCKLLLERKPGPHYRGQKRDRFVPGCTRAEWIAALRRSWSISGDCFRCEISALPLDTSNAHGPLALTCDHDPPGSQHVYIVAWVINDMKNDHDLKEFYRNVACLAEIVSAGSPQSTLADKYVTNFSDLKHWRRK
jgi:hypothetical protein